MAKNVQPGGFELEQRDYEDFDGDGFFFGDLSELQQNEELSDITFHNNSNGSSEKAASSSVPSKNTVNTKLHGDKNTVNTKVHGEKYVIKSNNFNSNNVTFTGVENTKEAFITGSDKLTIDDFRTAIMRGNIDLVKTYLEQGFDVNSVLRAGWTGLLYAASITNTEIIKLLIQNGADVNCHKDLYSPLMAICGSGKGDETISVNCVALLIDNKADVNAYDRYHMTPLMYAAREGQCLIIKLLIAKGADISMHDNKGWTSLIWAVSRGHNSTVALLVEHGADLSKKCGNGQTASDIAASQGYQKICDLLERLSQSKTIDDTILQELTVLKPSSNVTPFISSNEKYERYGELELFLSGLEYTHLISVFREQNVTFSMLLRMTNDDLLKAGVAKHGERCQILDAIHSVHKKEWKPTSLRSVQEMRGLSSGEIISTVGNISKHLDYIGSTLAFINKQLHSKPEVMRQATDPSSLPKLKNATDESIKHTHTLDLELCQLQKQLHEIISSDEYKAVDLIPLNRSKTRKRRYIVYGSGALAVSILVVWKREFLMKQVFKLFH